MESSDPGDEHTGPRAYDTLRRLERRLDEASEAAERLIAQAATEAAGKAASAATGRRPPPAGWQIPDAAATGDRDSDVELLAQFVQSLRDLIPPELQHRLAEALRELLLAVRALIDWYLERLDRRRAEPAEVKDIPIL